MNTHTLRHGNNNDNYTYFFPLMDDIGVGWVSLAAQPECLIFFIGFWKVTKHSCIHWRFSDSERPYTVVGKVGIIPICHTLFKKWGYFQDVFSLENIN